MVRGLSSSEGVERVERSRNHKPENRPNELSPQRVGRFLAVASSWCAECWWLGEQWGQGSLTLAVISYFCQHHSGSICVGGY